MKILNKLLIISVAVGVFHLSRTEASGALFLQDQSKGMQAEEYVKKRRKASKPNRTATAPVKKRYYRVLSRSTGIKRPILPEPAYIGFTLWRFEDVSSDAPSKILREVDARTNKPTAARRIESETFLSVGDRIRIGIESGSHPGYMYVINREKYTDGSYGTASLIYPTSGIQRDGNYVQPGVLNYLPSPRYNFEIQTDTETKQSAEELIVIVSPKMLIDPASLKGKPIEISDALINEWIKKWRVDVTQFELEDGVGEGMTESEQSAGVEEKSLKIVPVLTQDDPVPQTVYRMNIKRGNPVLATIEMKIRRPL